MRIVDKCAKHVYVCSHNAERRNAILTHKNKISLWNKDIPSAIGYNGIACGTSSSETSIAMLLMPSDKKIGISNIERTRALPSSVLVSLSYVIKDREAVKEQKFVFELL